METFGEYWWILLIVLFIWWTIRPPNWLKKVLRRETYDQPRAFDWLALADCTWDTPSEYREFKGEELRGYDVGFWYLYGDGGFLISYYSQHTRDMRIEEIKIIQGEGAQISIMFHDEMALDHLYLDNEETSIAGIAPRNIDLLYATVQRMRNQVDR